MSEKNDFVHYLQEKMTALAQISEIAAPMDKFYNDKGFPSGGADPIIDADITSTGMTAVEVLAVITLLQQLDNFQGNSAVTQGDYKSTMNKARLDIKGSS